MESVRKVRVMINPNSGPISSLGRLYQVLERYWDVDGVDLSYQISRSEADGRDKVRRAVADGVDTVLVAGGDGMINSIGRELIGTDTALGVIPTGSGNGFARHFDIPLNYREAAAALKRAKPRGIDVGTVNGRPFFVTASMAWDAALVEHFERSPVRGILPYVFSAMYGYLEYEPQAVQIVLDSGESIQLDKPLILTVANMTQYGGGAIIAPQAQADDGLLELVAIGKSAANLIANLPHIFDGRLGEHDSVIKRKFARLRIERERAAPLQIDGELIEAAANVEVDILPRTLKVLVPGSGE